MSFRRIAITSLGIVLGGGLVFAATPLGRDLLFHTMPFGWTGEADRLAAALQIGRGSAVADIGAGNGALIIELARRVGPDGRAYASELTAGQRQRIADRADAAGAPVSVIEAAERSTNLPDACCAAIVMRMVMHHVSDRGLFARDLRRSVRPGGRVAIIDFSPGALPHLAADHGVNQDEVVAAFAAAGFAVAARDDNWGGRTFLIVFAAP